MSWKKFKNQLENAFNGNIPELKVDLPSFLDVRKTLEIFVDILLSTSLFYIEGIKKSQDEGILFELGFTGNPR